MRLILWFFAAAFIPLALGKCGTCSLSGDQHFITLDGAEHHYYGRGWHRLYQLDRFEVQCLFADCKTGAETIDGHRRRNDGRRICLRACRAQFSPPGSVCPQVVNWEPLQIDALGQSQIEVNGARLLSGKGISQAAKDHSWWLRIERVGKDAAAVDVMLGGGAGGLSLRLGPKRIVTVTVRGLQGGRGLCGSCDEICSNDLAGATHLNVSDIDGHNRFAEAHRRGAGGFALVPVKPECDGGTAIKEDEDVAKLMKEAEEAREQEEYIYGSNEKLAMVGSDVVRDGAPDYDPKLIVPPIATFSNKTLMESVVRDCQAGMFVSPNDERMKIAIDNCVLDKARGRGFELAAASNVVAYVQSLMINEQSDLALQRLPLSNNFCAMCQSAIQTFVVNTKPILRHVVEKQAHCYDPGVATYSALVPAPFDLPHPELTPRPTRYPALTNLTLAMSFLKPVILPENNASVPNISSPDSSKSGSHDKNQSRSRPSPRKLNETESAAPLNNTTTPTSILTPGPETPVSNSSGLNNATQSQPKDDNVGSEPPTSSPPKSESSAESSTKPKSKDPKKPKSEDEPDSGKYHLKGDKPVSNEDDEDDEDDDDDEEDDDSKTRRRKKGKDSKKKKKKKPSKKKHTDDDDGGDSDEEEDDYKKKENSDDDDADAKKANVDDKSKAKPEKAQDANDVKNDAKAVPIPSPMPIPFPAPIPSPEPKVKTPEPTMATTRAPVIPGAFSDMQIAQQPMSIFVPLPNPTQLPNPVQLQPSESPSPLLPSNEPGVITPEQQIVVAQAEAENDAASVAYPVVIRATPINI